MTLTLELSPEVEGTFPNTSLEAKQPEAYETAADGFADLIGLFSYESTGYDDQAFAEVMAEKHGEAAFNHG